MFPEVKLSVQCSNPDRLGNNRSMSLHFRYKLLCYICTRTLNSIRVYIPKETNCSIAETIQQNYYNTKFYYHRLMHCRGPFYSNKERPNTHQPLHCKRLIHFGHCIAEHQYTRQLQVKDR